MKLILSAFFFLVLSCSDVKAQKLMECVCDSTILSASALQRCQSDTLFTQYLPTLINYITFYKTQVLPKYRLRRQELKLPVGLAREIKELKAIYDSTLNHKIQVFEVEMDQNQEYVQPKTFIGSSLLIRTFRFYPDIYAILINPIHIALEPKSDRHRIREIENRMQKLYASLQPDLKEQLLSAAKPLLSERRSFQVDTSFEIFQGDIPDEQREVYQLLDYLLWTE